MDRYEALMILASRPVPSFGAAYKAAAALISLTALIANAPERTGLYRDICRIISDVYMHRPAGETVIDGERTTYGYVQEIYTLLDDTHVQDVADALERYPREIRFKKAFIRTALYNRIFEQEADATNEYAVTHGA